MPEDNKKAMDQVIEVMTNQVSNIVASNASKVLKDLDSQIKDDEGCNEMTATVKLKIEKTGTGYDIQPLH